MKKSVLMLIIGGLLWITFLGLLNGLTYLGANFYLVELILIPVSVVAYFVLTCRYAFHLPLSWARWWSFAWVSACCWAVFHAVVEFSIGRGVPVLLATLAGAAANAVTNVVIQRRTVFRIKTALNAKDYPVLARVWDNNEDAVFDSDKPVSGGS